MNRKGRKKRKTEEWRRYTGGVEGGTEEKKKV